MRNTKRGSWYVEALTQVFSEHACDMHVADMLVKVSRCGPSLCARLRGALRAPPPTAPPSTLLPHRTRLHPFPGNTTSSDFGPPFLPLQVNGLIKEREGYAPGTEFHRCKEMSEYCSTLCRHLYLFPGHPPT